MCECGCGDLAPDKVVRLGDKVLAIEVYPGCRDCETGLMVVLNLFTQERAEDFFDLEPTEIFEPDEQGYAEISMPILGPDDLIEVVKEMEKDGNPLTDYESLSDWLSDHGLELLQRALSIQMGKTQ